FSVRGDFLDTDTKSHTGPTGLLMGYIELRLHKVSAPLWHLQCILALGSNAPSRESAASDAPLRTLAASIFCVTIYIIESGTYSAPTSGTKLVTKDTIFYARIAAS